MTARPTHRSVDHIDSCLTLIVTSDDGSDVKLCVLLYSLESKRECEYLQTKGLIPARCCAFLDGKASKCVIA